MAAAVLNEAAIFDTARWIESLEERRLYLEQACGNDATLKDRIEALLRVYHEPDFLISPPAGCLVNADGVTEGPGAQIGPYKLLEQIGEGGFGIVFTAEQRQPLRRIVALKILKPGMDTRQVLARFEAERQALALMDHPNIARIFDGGQTMSGRPYFVMELVKGVPITRYCDENGLTPRERLILFVAVCEAVQHAHQKGIIHRDLKPSNVLIAAFDGKPSVKVIDFGVAKTLGQQLTDRTLVTGFGGVIGTLEYMSPEQAEFNARDIDTRADIYSLGVLLYELLTGTTPLTRERLEHAAVPEALRLIREEEAPKPSTRITGSKVSLRSISTQRKLDFARLRGEVRGELDWIVMKAIDKDRDRRYSTAIGLARDIDRYLKQEPVEAGPPSATYKLRKFASKNRKLILVAGVFVGLLAVATAVSSWLAIWATTAERLASRERDRADAEAKQANRHLYAAHLNLAQAAWEDARVGRLTQLLEQHRPRPGEDDLRGFEWYYWDRLAGAPLATLSGHTNRIVNLAYSPDGKQIASASQDYTAKVFDAETGRELHTLVGHSGYVVGIAFSPDGKQVATSGADLKIKLWDSETGELLRTMSGHRNWVVSVAFSPDGKQLASASHDGALRLWNVSDGQGVRTIAAHPMLVMSVVFSPDGKQLASASKDRTVKLWNAASGEELRIMKGHTGDVAAIAFSPDGQLLASASLDRTVRIWEVNSGQCLHTFDGHKERVFGVAFSPNGEQVASASVDQTVKLWDVASGSEVHTLKGHSSWVSCLAFSPDGSRLATASDDQTIKLWDAGVGQETMVKLTEGSSVLCVAFCPSGKHIASGGHHPYVSIWDAASGLRIHKLKGHAGAVHGVAFNHDGKQLASSGADKAIKLWSTESGEQILSFSLPAEAFSTAFSPDDAWLATGSEDKLVRLWDRGTGEVKLTLTGHTKAVRSVAFCPDGNLLASASLDQTIKLWDLKTGEEIRTFKGHAAGPTGVASVAISPDGKWLVSGGADKIVKVWDVNSGRELWSLPGHSDWVSSVAISSDGKRLASSSADKTIKIWDLMSGQETLTLRGHESLVLGVTFAPDDLRLVSAGFDGVVGLWDARPWTERLRIESEAKGMIDTVRAHATSRRELIHQLEESRSTAAAIRAAALEMAERWTEDEKSVPRE